MSSEMLTGWRCGGESQVEQTCWRTGLRLTRTAARLRSERMSLWWAGLRGRRDDARDVFTVCVNKVFALFVCSRHKEDEAGVLWEWNELPPLFHIFFPFLILQSWNIKLKQRGVSGSRPDDLRLRNARTVRLQVRTWRKLTDSEAFKRFSVSSVDLNQKLNWCFSSTRCWCDN